MPLTLRAGCCSLQSRRSENEDRVAVAEWPDAVVCVAADGMGGGGLGRQASARAVETLLANLGKPARDRAGGLPEALAAAFELAQDQVLALQQGPRRAGSTATLLLWFRDSQGVHFAHIGDSAAFLYRDGRLQRLTVVHDIAQALVAAGTLTAEQAAVNSWSGPRIFRFLGMDYPLGPDLFTTPARAGDRFLLCTDGLWVNVDERDLARRMGGESAPGDRAEALCRRALDNGARDNTSAVVIDVVGEPRRP